MKVIHSISELPHPVSETVGLVPTMGAFHRGHLDLMRHARRKCDVVVVSVFVNPTQFGANEDFDRYPRDLERDGKLAEEVGVDVLFAPTVADIYPRKTTTVHVGEVTERWEGTIRPGHFDGVATVVAKLFNIVRPTVAYFGQKDFQQCAVVCRMVEDLNMPLSVEILPTTREPDGLAMSSRNAYLSEEDRQRAPTLYRVIRQVTDVLRSGELEDTDVDATLDRARKTLSDTGFVVDYLEWVAADTLQPVRDRSQKAAVIVAARLDKTRLIDNIVF